MAIPVRPPLAPAMAPCSLQTAQPPGCARSSRLWGPPTPKRAETRNVGIADCNACLRPNAAHRERFGPAPRRLDGMAAGPAASHAGHKAFIFRAICGCVYKAAAFSGAFSTSITISAAATLAVGVTTSPNASERHRWLPVGLPCDAWNRASWRRGSMGGRSSAADCRSML